MDSDIDIGLTQAKINYYEAMRDFSQGEFAPREVACVGAGIGGGFANTMELHVMKYDQAVNGPEAKEWAIAVEEEHK
jgi:formylmethanofuran dehydrogenase subunit E-like metal-binding protein